MIIYTSRHARLGRDLTENHVLPIRVLSDKGSIDLLRRKLPEGISVSDEQAFGLLEAFDRLPLSIAHAAGYIRFVQPPISVNEYMEELKSDKDLLELPPVLDAQKIRVSRRNDQAPKSVVQTLLVTHDLLVKVNSSATNLFYFMACLHGQSISFDILSAFMEAFGDGFMQQDSTSSFVAIALPKSKHTLRVALGELQSLALIQCGKRRLFHSSLGSSGHHPASDISRTA